MLDSALNAAVSAEAERAVALRRSLHRTPELGHAEYESTAAVAAHLEEAGLDPTVRTEGIGLHVDIGSGEPLIVFRADLDALPILEESGPSSRHGSPG